MSTATKTAPVLPISLTALPAGGTPYALTRYFEAREAWNADLTRDGKKVGFVAQDGRGGMTRALFDTRAEREAFEAYAATWRTAATWVSTSSTRWAWRSACERRTGPSRARTCSRSSVRG